MKLQRLLDNLGRVPTDDELSDILRMSRRGFFGACAAIAGSSLYAPAGITVQWYRYDLGLNQVIETQPFDQFYENAALNLGYRAGQAIDEITKYELTSVD